jgi:Flp pilus assembly protein TadB
MTAPLAGALAGSGIGAGLLLIVAGVRGTVEQPGRPVGAWARRWARLTGADLPRQRRVDRRRRLVAAAAALLVLLAATRIVMLGVGVAAAMYYLPAVLSRRTAGRARIARLEAMEGWTRRLADVMSVRATLESGIESTAGSAPAGIAEEVQALAGRLAARIRTEEALRAFADDLDDPVGDMIAAALILASARRGPRLVNALRRLAETVGAEVAMRRELEADREKPRSTARILTVFVLAALAFVMAAPQFRAPYHSLAGELVLAAAGGLLAFCFYWMWQMTSAPAEGRFLNPRSAGADPGVPR